MVLFHESASLIGLQLFQGFAFDEYGLDHRVLDRQRGILFAGTDQFERLEGVVAQRHFQVAEPGTVKRNLLTVAV